MFDYFDRLVHDREVQLYDGTRLIKHDSYDQLISNGQTAEELAKNGIFRIHPSFRIVALAEPPTGKDKMAHFQLYLILFLVHSSYNDEMKEPYFINHEK